MSPRSPLASTRLLPLGVLILAALAGCDNHELPTALGVEGAVFTQVATGPVVNSLLDDFQPGEGEHGCTDTKCTLRSAIAFAENGATITFASGLNGGTIQLDTSKLVIEGALTITGPGASLLTINGPAADRVFTVNPGAVATISGLTISGGSVGPHSGGGGIYNFGSLTLTGCVVTANGGGGAGGGIFNDSHSAVLTVSGSTISGNYAGWGGGIFNYNGTVTLLNTTISGNTASGNTDVGRGGGIFNESGYGDLTLRNSTVTGNTATLGGGIYSHTDHDGYYWTNATVIVNSTISGNSSGSGGGVYNGDGLTRIVHSTITGNAATVEGGGVRSYNAASARTDVKGSIIWGNTGAGTSPDDVAAANTINRYNSLGYNLIGAAGENVDFTQEFNATGDLTGVADAGIGALALNTPGTTATHALLAGSPAIDAAGACTTGDHPVSTDQRGVTRPQGTACDIGAYELEQTATVGPVLRVTINGQGRVTSSPAGIDCTHTGGTCSASFTRNTNVTLTATAAEDWAFVGWSGDASGTGSSTTVRMNADRNVVATFAEPTPPAGFSSSCIFTIHPKNDQRRVTVSWEAAEPGVTLIVIESDGTRVERQQNPTTSGSWSTNVKAGVPAYELRGGTSRTDVGAVLVAPGTACALDAGL
jgi:hypothetical protein